MAVFQNQVHINIIFGHQGHGIKQKEDKKETNWGFFSDKNCDRFFGVLLLFVLLKRK